MKKIIIIIFLFPFYTVMHAQDMKNMDMNKKTVKSPVQSDTYTCPMHPEIHASKPGNCPKCGMKLGKEKAMTGGKKMDMPDTSNPKKNGNMENMDMKTDTSKASSIKMDGMQMNMVAEPTYTAFDRKYIVNNMQKTVRYELYIADTIVTYGKTAKRAIAVNGQIPMPALTFTEGDTAQIYVHNNLDEETALHWHGPILPNQYDGVPYLSQMPIKPHNTHIYKFPIVQNGTHFYHSHSMFQEQIGMYGMIIMNKRKEWNIYTIPVTLSEWADMKPEEINRRLHSANDWFAIEKGTTKNYAEVIKTGHFKTKINNEWKRMHAKDVSDVYYDNFFN